MTSGHGGRWKEGRAGAASLCYLGLAPSSLAEVARHHAAVGIRATVACLSGVSGLDVLVERNWDLALWRTPVDPLLPARLTSLDGRTERGWVDPPSEPPADATGCLYRVSMDAGSVPTPAPSLASMLPSRTLPAEVEAAQEAIERIVAEEGWAIWRIGEEQLARLGSEGHARLLSWLGDHHARIWCAPVRDIATWRPAPAGSA